MPIARPKTSQAAAGACLEKVLAADWASALACADRCAREFRFLGWADRAQRLDTLFWEEARQRLDSIAITAVVARESHRLPSRQAIESFVAYCRGVVTATLLLLQEGDAIDEPAMALIFSLSIDEDHRAAMAAWIEQGHIAAMASRLAELPGFAFLLLAMSPNDTVESFIARDAFRAAMLGRE